MRDIIIGEGKLAGKGTYAGRDFVEGEKVMSWELREVSQAQFSVLPKSEKIFVHSFWGKMYKFSEPSCYTNHSAKANTRANYKERCDYAIRTINKGEMITTNATEEFKFEVKSLLEALEGSPIKRFRWLRGGYRNAVVEYSAHNGAQKTLTLKRVDGSWRIVHEHLSKVV